jgi:hypothetical protein
MSGSSWKKLGPMWLSGRTIMIAIRQGARKAEGSPTPVRQCWRPLTRVKIVPFSSEIPRDASASGSSVKGARQS